MCYSFPKPNLQQPNWHRNAGSGPVRSAIKKLLLNDNKGAALVDYAIVLSVFSLLVLGSLNLFATLPGKNLNRTSASLTNMSYTP